MGKIFDVLDLTSLLEVFLITNGRSTFSHAKGSIEAQKHVTFKTTIHEGMDWLSANRQILKVCKAPFFVRVDDDMILNPHAIRFMWHCVKAQSSRIALRGFKLWEPYSNKVVKGIKVYNLALAKDIGFRISDIGKIDKLFTADAKKRRKKVIYSDDVLGIHACSTFKEHLRYALMRGEDKGSGFSVERAWMKHHINRFSVPLRKQFKMANKFIRRLNKRTKSDFFRFLREYPHPDLKDES